MQAGAELCQAETPISLPAEVDLLQCKIAMYVLLI